jgi:uncharacterized protein YggT (Ycf19 family)
MSENRDQRRDDGLELINDKTIERLLMGAKALVVVVYAVVIVTFVILALGFFLRLVGASPEAPFVEWAYRNTDRAMQPFRGMFPVRDIDGRSVFDASLLFAAALYGFIAIGLHALFEYLSARVRGYQRRAAEEQREAEVRQAAEAERAARAQRPAVVDQTKPQTTPTVGIPGRPGVTVSETPTKGTGDEIDWREYEFD